MNKIILNLLLCLLFLINSCGVDSNSNDNDLDSSIVSNASVTISLTNDECNVTTANATVTASDISSIGPKNLDISGSLITGTLNNIPVGSDRLFTVKALNSDSKIVYEGSSKSDIEANQTATVTVVLQRNTINCPYSQYGNANINGSLENLPVDGLFAYYPFNGNASDESGNTQNGSVTGATLSSDRFGSSSKSYSFDGNDYITISENDNFDITSDFSISVWIKPSENQSGTIINKHANGNVMM